MAARTDLDWIYEERKRQNRWKRPMCVISALVFIVTMYLLMFPAEAMTDDLLCGLEAHVHTAECYLSASECEGQVLVCDPGRSGDPVAHVHNERCYDTEGRMICPLEERVHVHDESCFDEEGRAACRMLYHQHDDTCFRDAAEAGDALVLCCGKPAHSHVLTCCQPEPEPNPESDPEDLITAETEPAQEAAPAAEGAVPAPQPVQLQQQIVPVAAATDLSNAINLETFHNKKHMGSIVMKYRASSVSDWITINGTEQNLPANAEYRLEVSYVKLLVSDLKAHGNLVYLEGIPSWIQPENDGQLLYNGVPAASMRVEDGTLIIQFYDSFIQNQALTTELSGTLYVRGEVDWTMLEGDDGTVNLPGLNMTLDFEDDLAKKYGKVMVDKKNSPELVSLGNDLYAVKYTVTVINPNDVEIPDVYVKDEFTQNDKFATEYCNITNGMSLGATPNGVRPYETVRNVQSYSLGRLSVSNKVLTWTIGTLKPHEERTLTYYVKLDEHYTGAVNRGSIVNTVQAFAGDVPKNSAMSSYTPDVKATVNKVSSNVDLDGTGTGTIKYTVKVKADASNSYSLVNARFSDFFAPKFRGNVTYENIKVVSSKRTYTNPTISYQTGQFDLTLPHLDPGETVTVTYTVRTADIFALENGEVTLTNTAAIYTENDGDRGTASNKQVAGGNSSIPLRQNSWLRKIPGGAVGAQRINMTPADAIYLNKNRTPSSDTYFDIPDNSQVYNVVLNEGGVWDMSSTVLKDAFSDEHVRYCGYVQVRQYPANGNFTLDTDNNTAVDLLDQQSTPVRTVWLKIDDGQEFSFTPSDLGFAEGKYTYLLTYYAKLVDMGSTGQIVIANDFRIYGTIGNGKYPIAIPGIQVGVATTVHGAINYNASKSALYFERSQEDRAKGTLYWLIKLDGTLPAGLSIKDALTSNNMNFGDDAIAGVFTGPEGMDFSGFTSYEQFKQANGGRITELTGGVPQITDIPITNVNQLDGMDVALKHKVNNSETNVLYLTPEYIRTSNGYDGLLGVPLTTETWHFEKVAGTTDRFYISNGSRYLNINPNKGTDNNNHVIVSSEPQALRVMIRSGSDTIRILSETEHQLTKFGAVDGQTPFASYKRRGLDVVDNNDYFTPCYVNIDNYSYYWENGTNKDVTVHILDQMEIGDGRNLYIVVKSNVVNIPTTKLASDQTYENALELKEATANSWVNSDDATYVYKISGSVMKEAKEAYTYDGTRFYNAAGNPNDTYRIRKEWLPGTGTYAVWLVNVNWDGKLSGMVEITDQIPEGMEPVYTYLHYWGPDHTNVPTYPEIEELEVSGDWIRTERTYYAQQNKLSADAAKIPENLQTIVYYYNPTTRQLRWRVDNLQSNTTIGYNHMQLNFQVLCRVTDRDAFLSPEGKDFVNNVEVDKDGSISKDSDIMHVGRMTNLKKTFGDGSNGNYTSNGLIPFKIVLNELNEQIGTEPYLPPLIDEISGNLSYIESSIHVKDANDQEVQGYTYTITTGADGAQVLTIRNLPSDRKLTITYYTKSNTIQPENSTLQISNRAYWLGYPATEQPQISNAKITFALSGDVTLGEHPVFRVYKSDSELSSKYLQGAEIGVYNTRDQLVTSGTTDANGVISFNSTSLNYDTVYYLKEIKAPTGYQLDETKHYLVSVRNSQPSAYRSYTDILLWDAKMNGTVVDYYFKNSRQTVQLVKKFENANGTAMQPVPGTYSFGIFEKNPLNYPDSKPLQTITMTYPEGGGAPVYKLDGVVRDVPEFTCVEINMYYYIYELDSQGNPIRPGSFMNTPGMAFQVLYDNAIPGYANMVTINCATFHITNRTAEFRLPKAGGMGTVWYFAAGGALMAGALLLYLIRRRKAETAQ